MCGRFVTLSREELAEVVSAIERGERLRPLSGGIERAQAFPGNDIPVFGAPDGQLAIGSFRWGFPVEWGNKPVFNTRIESALSGKGMWRDLVRDGRCIVPAASFFEPHVTEVVRSPKTGRPMKRAYEFADPTGAPLLLAGLTDGRHCSVVTTEPNRWVEPVHNRMPLLLRFEEVGKWFSGDLDALRVLADRTAQKLEVHPETHDDEPDQLTLF